MNVDTPLMSLLHQLSTKDNLLSTEDNLTLEEEAQLYKLQLIAQEWSPEQLMCVTVIFYRHALLKRRQVAQLTQKQSAAITIILLLLSAIALITLTLG